MKNFMRVALCALPLVSLSCGLDLGGKPFHHLRCVPSGTVAWMTVSVLDLIDDDGIRQMADLSEVYALVEAIGLEMEDVELCTGFSLPVRPELVEATLVTGFFQTSDLLTNLIEQGWQEESYEEAVVICSATRDRWMAAIGDNTVVVGDEIAVCAVLDVEAGRYPNLLDAGEEHPIITECAGSDAPLVIGVIIPQEKVDAGGMLLDIGKNAFAMDKIPVVGGMLSQIGMATGFGVQIWHFEPEFQILLSCLMETEISAKIICGSANLLQGLATSVSSQGMGAQEQQAFQTISDMSVTRDGAKLMVEIYLLEGEPNG